uniref:Transmembrane and coiled-coil domain-containing protein 4 n=1 Tax=Macrostomum lignano TaxID=282301 RepID=A0A1I8FNY8_9PLAT
NSREVPADVLHKRPDSIRNSATAILRHGQADCSMLAVRRGTADRGVRPRLPRDGAAGPPAGRTARRLPYDARARYLLKHVPSPCGSAGPRWRSGSLKTAALLNDRQRGRGGGRGDEEEQVMLQIFAVGGGLLIGLTGGLAAPLVAAGAGVIIGGAGAAAIGTAAGAAVLGSVFGVAGAGLTGWKMRKRVGSLAQFQFVQLTPPPTPQLHLVGWIDQGDLDFLLPWQSLAMSPEQYALCWESRYLKEMGQALDYFMSYLKSFAIQVLADVLLSREYGQRPVTLIGFSMGAKLIFSCLQELASRKK